MTDRAKLEQMLQYLINEDKEKAEELFHELVVEKSREIYENLLDDDIQVEETEDEDLDEESDDEDLEEESDDEDLEENYGIDEIGGDPSDDMMSDVEGDLDDMGDDDMDSSEGGSEAATKDDVMDIKDALEELKAEFEAMLAGSGDDESDDDMGDDESDDDMGDDESDDEGNPFAKENVREYVEKVQNGSGPWGSTKGDNGVNTKSIVAGKNDMGGTTANIVKGGTSETGGTKGGLAQPSPKDMTTGNVNVPGGNAGKTGFKKKEPGHGAEKKGTGDMGDKSAGSPINGAPKRAK